MRGSNQVAVALVKIPFVKINGSGKNGMLSGGYIIVYDFPRTD